MNDFFASIYENGPLGFYSSSNFSQEIFNRYLYQKYGITVLISTVSLLLVYYKVMDKPRFAKHLFWVIVLLVNGILNYSFLYVDTTVVLESEGFLFNGEYASLAMVNGLYALILFVLLSVGLKFISVNNSKIPF